METLLIGNLGTSEIIVILIIVLLLFGGKKIPELMRGLGSGIREFNNAKNNISNEIREGMKDADRKNLDSEQK
jgi:sec-independent protein translocase protein TatA